MKTFQEWLAAKIDQLEEAGNGPVPSFAGATGGLPPMNPGLTQKRDNTNLSRLLQALDNTGAGTTINNYLQQTKNATQTLAFAQKQFPQLVSKILGASGATVAPPPTARTPVQTPPQGQPQDPRVLQTRPMPGTMAPPPGGIR